jgi:hypothetical protein
LSTDLSIGLQEKLSVEWGVATDPAIVPVTQHTALPVSGRNTSTASFIGTRG